MTPEPTHEHTNPFTWFSNWWAEALALPARFPNAVILSTASHDGIPSARVVLLKEFSEQGFTFFTNYQSHKASDLDKNPRAALTFYWDALGRQIRITGDVKKTSRKVSEAYFHSRPRGSQLGAWASQQSSEIHSRDYLLEQMKSMDANYPNNVPCPPHWGGYLLTPTSFEYWVLQEDRLHDRILFEKHKKDWKIKRLAP